MSGARSMAKSHRMKLGRLQAEAGKLADDLEGARVRFFNAKTKVENYQRRMVAEGRAVFVENRFKPNEEEKPCQK